MELDKDSINDIKFTKRHRRCYDALEVDAVLDEIAAAAAEQAQELQTLRAICDEYMQVKSRIEGALLMAQRSAEELLVKTKQKCDGELSALVEKKSRLEIEINALEQYKVQEVSRIRGDIAKLFGNAGRESSRE